MARGSRVLLRSPAARSLDRTPALAPPPDSLVARYPGAFQPFYCSDEDYMSVVNMVFGSFNLHDEFCATQPLNYLADIVRVLVQTGQTFNCSTSTMCWWRSTNQCCPKRSGKPVSGWNMTLPCPCSGASASKCL